MITRPLDLASRLRPEPRSFHSVFYVNVGLIVLCFFLFGSRYVLSPGLGLDFQLPESEGANAEARLTTHVITVVNAGQILVGDGRSDLEQLPTWLNAQAKTEKHPVLLIRASAGVPAMILTKIIGMAEKAGFSITLAAEEPAKTGSGDQPLRTP